jgi:hypothetical protein
MVFVAIAGCRYRGRNYVRGGPDIRPGQARIVATAVAPHDRGARIVAASGSDIFMLRRYHEAYVLTRLGDTLNRIWTHTFGADKVRDLRLEALVAHERTITAVCSRLMRDPEMMEYYAVTCDALTGAVRSEKIIARYKHSGSEEDAEYCRVAFSPDSSMFAFYRTDTRQQGHHGSLTFDVWACTANCDTVFERHMPITITDEEKDNEGPIVPVATLDHQGRLLQLQCRDDSTLRVTRFDLWRNRTDTLTTIASGFDFKDEYGVFDAPVMIVDSMDGLHLLGIRRDGSLSLGKFGQINLLSIIRFDFHARTVSPGVQCAITPEIAESMGGRGVLDSYTFHEVFLLPDGGYLCVVEQRYFVKAHEEFSRITGLSYKVKSQLYSWNYGVLALDSGGHGVWATSAQKRVPGQVRCLASPPARSSSEPPARVPEFQMVTPDENGAMMWVAFRATDGKVRTSGVLFETNLAYNADGRRMTWVSDTTLVYWYVSDQYLPWEEKLRMEHDDKLADRTIGPDMQAVVKLKISPPSAP